MIETNTSACERVGSVSSQKEKSSCPDSLAFITIVCIQPFVLAGNNYLTGFLKSHSSVIFMIVVLARTCCASFCRYLCIKVLFVEYLTFIVHCDVRTASSTTKIRSACPSIASSPAETRSSDCNLVLLHLCHHVVQANVMMGFTMLVVYSCSIVQHVWNKFTKYVKEMFFFQWRRSRNLGTTQRNIIQHIDSGRLMN